MAELNSHKLIIFIFILISISHLSWLSSCVYKTKAIEVDRIAIDNQLNECLEIIPDGIQISQNAYYLKAKLASKTNIGGCGCKSAMLSYKVLGIDGGHEAALHHGDLTSLNQTGYKFLICNETDQSFDTYILKVQCLNPD